MARTIVLSTMQHQKVIPIVPVPVAAEEQVSLYEAHKKVYPRSVTGLFARWRWAFVWLTQIVFYGLPWLSWGTEAGSRQAVLFDLAARRFYLFGEVLYPQDFIYLTGLLVISALSLIHISEPTAAAIGGMGPCRPAVMVSVIFAGPALFDRPHTYAASTWICASVSLPCWAGITLVLPLLIMAMTACSP